MEATKVSKIRMIERDTYENDGHDGENHDRTALFDRLLGLLRSLPSLHNTGLLLLQRQQVIDLNIC